LSVDSDRLGFQNEATLNATTSLQVSDGRLCFKTRYLM
jgi:hypothetical protein